MNKLNVKLLILLFLVSCGSPPSTELIPDTNSSVCRGEWNKTENGVVTKKFNEFWHPGMKACLTEPVKLSEWENQLLDRSEDGINCTPQIDLPSLWLKSANNFYTYRNDRVFIELDASTGEARRLIIGEMDDESISFIRQKFCYYLRTDIEVEPVNPSDHGSQMLFDLELAASSSPFNPMEIFTYVDLGGGMFQFTRFDQNGDIDWSFCPMDNTPETFCNELNNGNIFFYPDINVATQTALKAEAILIRSEHNVIQITENEFNSKWNSTVNSELEVGTWDYIKSGGIWEYLVVGTPDEPLFVGRAWRKYLRNERSTMPDIANALINRPICYFGRQEVTLDNGASAIVYGEICYNQGVYSFTQN